MDEIDFFTGKVRNICQEGYLLKNRDERLILKSRYQVGLDIAFLKMMYPELK